jgi:hypothetical protein
MSKLKDINNALVEQIEEYDDSIDNQKLIIESYIACVSASGHDDNDVDIMLNNLDKDLDPLYQKELVDFIRDERSCLLI